MSNSRGVAIQFPICGSSVIIIVRRVATAIASASGSTRQTGSGDIRASVGDFAALIAGQGS
jgi:hypothetical protein